MANNEILTQTVLLSWKQTLGRAEKAFAALSDEDLQKEIAPGKNRIYYLLGHLMVVHDLLLPLLRIGERMYPELDAEFLTNPDRTFPQSNIQTAELRAAWTEINAKVTAGLEAFTPEQWLERHASVSEEDFAKEPHRNRLAVVLSRTNHVSMHIGQILLAK